MLMQNFKSAADLEITERQKEALVKTLVLLETGKLEHVQNRENLTFVESGHDFSGKFNMDCWSHLRWDHERNCEQIVVHKRCLFGSCRKGRRLGLQEHLRR